MNANRVDILKLQDSWSSVLGIVDHFAANQDTFIAAAGPGHWNDPDMVRKTCIGVSLGWGGVGVGTRREENGRKSFICKMAGSGRNRKTLFSHGTVLFLFPLCGHLLWTSICPIVNSSFLVSDRKSIHFLLNQCI